MDNSIEVFNCPLCSFCETGLDRLVKHIRQHIKPEPKSLASIISSNNSSRNESVNEQILPRDYEESTNPSNQSKEMNLDDCISNLSSKELTASTIGLFSSVNRDPSPPGSASQTTKTNTNSGAAPSKVGLPNDQRNAMSGVKGVSYQHQKQQHIQLGALPSEHQSPHLVNLAESGQQPQIYQTMQISPPGLSQPPPGHQMMFIRPGDAPKYLSREQHGKVNYSHPPQYKQYVHTEQYVPIAPANVTKFQDGKQMIQLEMHDVYQRGGPQHGNRHQNVAFVQQPQQQHQQQYPRNVGSMKCRQSQSEMQGNFPVRQGFHPTQPQRQQLVQHSSAQGGIIHHQRQQQQPSPQYQHPKQRGYKLDHFKSRVQSRVSGVPHQLSEMQNVGFPNNGSMLMNPEQLLKLTGSNATMDQLAGLLVIPLKKTAEIAVQTDPVEFYSPFSKQRQEQSNSVSSGVQTDLRMQYVSEENKYIPSPVIDHVRSTDSLFECLICGEEFAADQLLQQHVSSMHKHVCDNCFHASTSLEEHTAHMLECGKCDAELLCMDCNNLFPSLKRLNQHRIKVHFVRMPFRCGICNQPFETHDGVMHHMSTHDSDVPEFKCRYCTKVFQSSGALSLHFKRHKQVDVEHQCRFCKKSYNTDKLLRDHIGIAHVIKEFDVDDDIEAEMSPPDYQQRNKRARSPMSHTVPATSITVSQNMNRKYFLCRYCDLAFKNKELLSRHIKMCSKNGRSDVTCFVCDVCKEFFGSDDARKMHLKNDHRRQNGYRCPKCSKVYRTWTRLKFHTKQQHLKKNCPDCNAVFTKEHVLRKHQEDVHGKLTSQNGDRVYKCSDCSLSLYTLTDLTMHRRTQHPERKSGKNADLSSNATMLSFIDNPLNINGPDEFDKPSTTDEQPIEQIDGELSAPSKDTKPVSTSMLACERCNSTFDSTKRLKNHLGLTHGERPFVCDICNKRFQYSSQIIWHMKNHKNRTALSTKTSTKLWKAKSKLKAKSSMLGSNNYVCHFCGAHFKQEKLLKNHKGVVHKIKLFSCYICAAKFGHSTELIWHVRTCKAKFLRENPGKELPAELPVSSDNGISQESNADEEFAKNGNENAVFDDESSELVETQEAEDAELQTPSIQLSNEEAEELLQNDPEYDHSRGEYSCPLCRKSTKSITGMKTHYGRVHGIWGKESSHKYANGHKVTIWPCRNCDQEFQSFHEIQSHCLEDHGLNVNKEDLDFETREEFVQNQPTKAALYTCQTCGVSFDNSKSIRVHTFKKHGILLNDVSLNESKTNNSNFIPQSQSVAPKDDDELRYKCPRCKSQFRTTKAIRVHSFKRHGVILNKQDIVKSRQRSSSVDASTNNEIPTTLPSNLQNGQNKGRDLIESPNPCDRCGRVFGNYRALFTHYRQAHRITDPNHVFVPRKPSRTELSIQSFSGETNDDQASSEPVQSSPVKQYPEAADSVECPKCQRIFTNHKSFVAHLYSAHKVSKEQYHIYWPNGIPILPRESSMCPTCNKECLDERAMRIHMFKAHGTHYRDYANEQELNRSSGSLSSTLGMVTMVTETSFSSMQDDAKESNDDAFTCSVCQEVCKSRRTLISHEFDMHGVRWEGGKRKFPDDLKIKLNLGDINKTCNSPTPVENGADDSIAINNDNNNNNNKTSTPIVAKPFVCALCEASYHNRRAITTHLCRVHKYKKDDVQLYFAQHFSDTDAILSPYSDNNNGDVANGDGKEEAMPEVKNDDEFPKAVEPSDDVEMKEEQEDATSDLVIDENKEESNAVVQQQTAENVVQILRNDYDTEFDSGANGIANTGEQSNIAHIPVIDASA